MLNLTSLEKEKSTYKEFCALHPDIIHPQNLPIWLDAVCEGGDWGAKAVEKKGEIVGIWPYFVKKKKGLSFITQPPFTQSLGPYLIYPASSDFKRNLFEKDTLSALFNQVLALRVDFINQQIIPEINNWLPLYWNGCTESTYYTYIKKGIRGLTEEQLLQTYSKSARKNILKVQEEGYHCEDAVKLNFTAEDFYNLHVECLKKLGKKVSYSKTLLQNMITATIPNNGKMFCITDSKGKVWGAKFGIYNEKNFIGINTAVDHTISGLGYLCKHGEISLASKVCDSYNAAGSMIKGVESVYSLFGGELTPYFAIHKGISRKYRMIETMVNLYKVF